MTTAQISALVDARGMQCPMPIIKTAQWIRSVAPGELLEVLATDPGSVEDFGAWTRTTGNALVEQRVEGGVYHFVIRRT